jgi:hypothetical protein
MFLLRLHIDAMTVEPMWATVEAADSKESLAHGNNLQRAAEKVLPVSIHLGNFMIARS